jgi:hypothetical protein
MTLSAAHIARLVDLVRVRFPGWSSFSDPRLEQDEILYKLKASAKAKEQLDATVFRRLLEERDYVELLKRVNAAASVNNLLYTAVPAQGDLGVLQRPELDHPSFFSEMYQLLYGDGLSPERLGRFVDYLRERQLPAKWTFPTYFLFLVHPDQDLFVKPRTFRRLLERLGMPGMLPATPSAGGYSFVLGLAESIRQGLADFGPRDMIDLHSAMWVAGNVEEGPKPEPTPEGEQVRTPPRRYWLLAAGEQGRMWADYQANGIATIGWDYLGDLRQYPDQAAIAQAISARPGREGYPTNDSLACYQFLHDMREGDAIIVKKGLRTVLGYGIVSSGYEHDPSRREYQQVRKTQWLAAGEWTLPDHLQLPSKTLTDVTEVSELLEYLLPLLTQGTSAPPAEPTLQPAYSVEQCAADTGLSLDTLTAWLEAIERKRQAIVYGPPGTGKTWTASHLARHLVERSDGFTDLVQFHPSYAYEDFIQGIRPESAPDGTVRYPLRPGRFLEFCARANQRSGRCVLIVDEINRGNLSRILGELMFLLEYRDHDIPLAGGGRFRIPANVRLIGTMNTADRSIALVDHALRRRFAFLPLYPDYELLTRYHRDDGVAVEALVGVLKEVNEMIADPHYAVGVSYFLTPELSASLENVWRMEIEPYLEEQFFDRRQRMERFRWENIRDRLRS